MKIAIDTNILFDILLPDPEYKDSSLSLIVEYSKKSKIIISEIVYAELASQFTEINILKAFLDDANIHLESTTTKGLWIAARAWKDYTENRDKSLQCSKCGNQQIIMCEECNEIITARQHIMSDFIVGGHAIEKAEKLITRGRGFYRKYFKDLKVDYPSLF